MNITETCSCGATLAISNDSGPMASLLAKRWREGHKHAEGVGICGDRAPVVIGPDGPRPQPWCELKAGHPGAHSDGEGHWMHEAEQRIEGDE